MGRMSGRSGERPMERPCGVSAREAGGSILLEGRVPSWQDKIDFGYFAAKSGYRGVVNDLEVAGAEWAGAERLAAAEGAPSDRPLEGQCLDVAIVGAGVIGCAIARELAKWDIKTILIEKEGDVAVHTSSRNDGMIHDGFAAKPGSLTAKYNVLGNRLW